LVILGAMEVSKNEPLCVNLLVAWEVWSLS
jgi:hypothetical protein